MSHLDDLIQRLCPNGVEYRPLADVCLSVSSGGTPDSSVDVYYDGDVPWLRTAEVDFRDIYSTERMITELGLRNSSAKWVAEDSVIVALYGATAGKVAVNKIPLTTNQACCNLVINPDLALYRFIYYTIASRYEELLALREGAQPNLSSQKVRSLRIALPPLEVQREIVRILDKVTKLEAELEARRKQYEHYRDKLLTFKELV